MEELQRNTFESRKKDAHEKELYIFTVIQCCAKIFDQINSSLYIRVAISKRTINNIEYKAMISKEDSIIHEHYYILL